MMTPAPDVSTCTPGLTAVVTLDLGRRQRQLLQRVQALVERLCAAEIALVVVHNDRGGAWDRRLRHAAAGWPRGARLVSGAWHTTTSNNSLLRNVGVRAVQTTHLVLLDADIYPDVRLLRALYRAVEEGHEPVAIAPCLYLTAAGTRHTLQGRDRSQIVERFLRFDKALVHHLASPSSVLVCSLEDYWRVGGFCEDYHGHGYEDFDFMVRLALAHDLIQPDPELLVDRTYNAPLLADGFRALLSSLCLNRILDKQFALHLYHDKPGRDPYYLQRAANAALFRQRMAQHLGDLPPAPGRRSARQQLYDTFFERCEARGIDSSHYYALFDARPDYLSRRGQPLRMVRRLLRGLPQWLARGGRRVQGA